jgi:hypothetical protein
MPIIGRNPTRGLEGTCEYPMVSHGKPVKSQPLIHSKNVQINGIKKRLDFRCKENHPVIPIKEAQKRQNKKVLKQDSHEGIPPYVLRLM